jgi:DNA invertase Pin-like site-specific DNA recombinase
MGAVNQWERESIAERTRDALRHKRSQGERARNVPFGYRVANGSKQLLPDATEQAASAAIRDLRQRGGTLRSIAAELNAQGHRSRRGTAWRYTYIAAMLATSESASHVTVR